MIRKIVTAPNFKLSQVSQELQKMDKVSQGLVSDLKDTLFWQKDPEGVGLSSVQIGILKRVFVLKIKPNGNFTVVINPEIVKASSKTNLDMVKSREPDLEGCLSVPGVYGVVERPWQVEVCYRDETFNRVTSVLKGFSALVFQHELDHLNGILFTQRVLEQGGEIVVG